MKSELRLKISRQQLHQDLAINGVPYQAKAGGAITWIEETDPNAEGTADKPITFKVGMEVYVNYYYTDGVKRYVCVQGGFPLELAENGYFTEMQMLGESV